MASIPPTDQNAGPPMELSVATMFVHGAIVILVDVPFVGVVCLVLCMVLRPVALVAVKLLCQTYPQSRS